MSSISVYRLSSSWFRRSISIWTNVSSKSRAESAKPRFSKALIWLRMCESTRTLAGYGFGALALVTVGVVNVEGAVAVGPGRSTLLSTMTLAPLLSSLRGFFFGRAYHYELATYYSASFRRSRTSSATSLNTAWTFLSHPSWMLSVIPVMS